VGGQLIVSISGISDRTVDDVDAFCAQLDTRGVPASFLVAPRMKGGYRLDNDAPTVEWLAGRRDGGDAIVLHGFWRPTGCWSTWDCAPGCSPRQDGRYRRAPRLCCLAMAFAYWPA
jgi:hypothetical protein